MPACTHRQLLRGSRRSPESLRGGSRASNPVYQRVPTIPPTPAYIWPFTQGIHPTSPRVPILPHHVVQRPQSDLHVRIHLALGLVLMARDGEVLLRQALVEYPRAGVGCDIGAEGLGAGKLRRGEGEVLV